MLSQCMFLKSIKCPYTETVKMHELKVEISRFSGGLRRPDP